MGSRTFPGEGLNRYTDRLEIVAYFKGLEGVWLDQASMRHRPGVTVNINKTALCPNNDPSWVNSMQESRGLPIYC